MLEYDFVVTVHDEIVLEFGGLPGFGPRGPDGVGAALERIENRVLYDGLDDVFGVAAMYAVAIARGHVFADANKRTGLTCALTFLYEQGIRIAKSPALEDIMVDVAEGRVESEDLAEVFFALWEEAELLKVGAGVNQPP